MQDVRSYEAHGLLEPERTAGGTRRYSDNDLDRLRRIGDLLAAGLNLAGISMVLNLETQNDQLRAAQQQEPETSKQNPPNARRQVDPSLKTLRTHDRSRREHTITPPLD